jgi:hypothetical protein
MKRWSYLPVVLISSTMTGCFWQKKPKIVQTPPPPPPVQSPSPPRPVASKPNPKANTKATTRAKPPVERRTAPPSVPPQPAKQASTPPAANVGAPAAPVGQMLSPAERTELTQAVNQSLSSARRNLDVLAGRTLTPDQTEQRKTIEIFISQAERARQSDLTTAANLARRAEVLAQSLAGVSR